MTNVSIAARYGAGVSDSATRLDDRAHQHPRQQQPERQHRRDDADQDALKGVRRRPRRGRRSRTARRRNERVSRYQARSLDARSEGHDAAMVSMISRATGVKSGCCVTRTKVSSSDRRPATPSAAISLLRDQPPFRQDHDPRAQLLDHVEAVRAEENHPAVGGEQREQRAEQQAGVDVEAGERLVEHEQIRIVHQRRGEQHALPHALRVRRHRAVAAVVQLEQRAAAPRSSPSSARRGMSRSRPTSIRYSVAVRCV